MKFRIVLLFNLLIFLLPNLSATDLKISNIEFQFPGDTTISPRVKMNIEWENAWHNSKNHDAVWIFVKFDTPDGNYHHAKVAAEGHQIVYNPSGISGRFEAAKNQVGIFIMPNQEYRGKINWTIEVMLDRNNIKDVNHWKSQCRVYGIEMVYIPQGGFSLGDPGNGAMEHQAFYKSKGNGEYGGVYEITDEQQVIQVGEAADNLFYQSKRSEYQGDQKGPIPADFPKGVQSFFCMKYELRQGQYAAFLNSISNGATHYRANFGGRDYYQNRGSIYFDRQTGKYEAESPNRPCNHITWDDAMAFADWAGLRPMTEFEFTKACRGPLKPIENQYPWGTGSKAKLQRGVNLSDELVMFNRMNESQLTDENRVIFGASYFWVMDLAGSLWEKVITIGDETGRAFTGNHGDGKIGWNGAANEKGWPSGIETSGYGYRGGGYYAHGRNYHGFNPHSPIAWRRFGSWSGGNRSIAYSTRFVRTSNQ